MQTLSARLVVNSAMVSFDSDPRGAQVRIDGRAVGETPLTVRVDAGGHRAELLRGGYKPATRRFKVVAEEDQVLPRLTLLPADGNLVLASDPSDATVTVDGAYKGRTPLEIDLPPGRTHEVRLTKAGFEPHVETLTLASGAAESVSVVLAPELGDVAVSSLPPNAELWVDGEPRGTTGQTLRLAATPHDIEVRKEGFEPYRTTITPRPGFPQEVHARLKTPEQVEAERFPAVLTTARGQELRLFRPGGIEVRLGAPRREPGRRANEAQRSVRLERPLLSRYPRNLERRVPRVPGEAPLRQGGGLQPRGPIITRRCSSAGTTPPSSATGSRRRTGCPPPTPAVGRTWCRCRR